MCFGVTSAFLAADFAIGQLYGEAIPRTDDFSVTSKATMGGVWDALDLIFGRELPRAGATLSHTPDALVFTAVCRGKERRIVFGFAEEYHERIARFFDAKMHPDKYPDGEFKRVKNSLIRDFLRRRARGDTGYFVTVKER
jgi:hypothetical protein